MAEILIIGVDRRNLALQIQLEIKSKMKVGPYKMSSPINQKMFHK